MSQSECAGAFICGLALSAISKMHAGAQALRNNGVYTEADELQAAANNLNDQVNKYIEQYLYPVTQQVGDNNEGILNSY